MSDKKVFNGGESGAVALLLTLFVPVVGSFYTRGISLGALFFTAIHMLSALWLFIPVVGWIIALICHLFFAVLNYNRVTKNHLRYSLQKSQASYGQ